MMKFIYGAKGTGKTKILIDNINEKAKLAKGNIVCISYDAMQSAMIDLNVKCVNSIDYKVSGDNKFLGFLKGLMAGNSDIESIYIDGINKITKLDLDELDSFFEELESVSAENEVEIVTTISASKDKMPKYLLSLMAKYE